MNTNQMTIYETEDGKVRIDVFFDKENVWLTQKLMAELFECSAIEESSVVRDKGIKNGDWII